MRYVIIMALWSIHIFWEIPQYMSGDTLWLLRATTHHFFHGNLLHLSLNSLSVFLLFKKVGLKDIQMMSMSYIIATISYASAIRPAIGFSDIIYSMVAFKICVNVPVWWKDPGTLSIIIILAATCLIPGISGTTHAVSFIMSMSVAMLSRKIKKTIDDYGRAMYK